MLVVSVERRHMPVVTFSRGDDLIASPERAGAPLPARP